jgi:endo-1,4-beta-xylanase
MLTRRSFLARAGLGAVAVLGGACTTSPAAGPRSTRPTTTATGTTTPSDGSTASGSLLRTAASKGIVYGSSTATWQFEPDDAYAALFAREAGMVFTEDDLLWYRLEPSRGAPLDFRYGDRIVTFADRNRQPVLATHLVWDEGLGDGWEPDELYTLGRDEAHDILFGTIRREVAHYRGDVMAWIVANEVTDGEHRDDDGFWTDEPWYQSLGPSYVAEAFELAHEQDPDAVLLINEFGFETGVDAASRRAAMLAALDHLASVGAPVHALGVQAHLSAAEFADGFDAEAYRAFLSDVASRGLSIFITEMDVLDDGLSADVEARDEGVADVYSRYLSAALAEPAVKVVLTFGLSDRYTWLEEDYPRDDGAPRRPLPFDRTLEPKPAYAAIQAAFAAAPTRTAV